MFDHEVPLPIFAFIDIVTITIGFKSSKMKARKPLLRVEIPQFFAATVRKVTSDAWKGRLDAGRERFELKWTKHSRFEMKIPWKIKWKFWFITWITIAPDKMYFKLKLPPRKRRTIDYTGTGYHGFLSQTHFPGNFRHRFRMKSGHYE